MYGFHFKRPPQQFFSHHNSFVWRQQRSISSRDTSCYAFDGSDGRSKTADANSTMVKIAGSRNTRSTRAKSTNKGIVVHGKIEENGTRFLFSNNNDNPTQAEVNTYFREHPDPNPQEIADILQRTVKWKKKRKIDMLIGDKLLIVISSLRRIMPVFNLSQLRNATVGVLDSLQVISPTDIETSGLFVSLTTLLTLTVANIILNPSILQVYWMLLSSSWSHRMTETFDSQQWTLQECCLVYRS